MASASVLPQENIYDDIENLPTLFNQGLDLYTNLGRSDEPTNSLNVQNNIKKCIKILEQATTLVTFADIFSRNEGIDEVATSNLQYLLLPALLGSLSLKLTSGERRDIVDVAEIYFKDFLKRCNEYSLSNYKFREEDDDDSDTTSITMSKGTVSELDQLTKSVNTRSNKIQRFIEQKELKKRLEDLKSNMENEHVDEEIKRRYFITMIKSYVYEAVDELHSINMEKPILEHIAINKRDDKLEPKRQISSPLKPVIITRNELQKAIYGAGYPSLPTMTVQEFYDKRVSDGIFPDPNKVSRNPGPNNLQEAALAGLSIDDDENEKAALESQIETDDHEQLKQRRERDEFNDNHRRGWGNRANRS